MGKAIVTLRIMPESPETDMDSLKKDCEATIDEFTKKDERKTKIEPVAFGLKSLNITFVMNEDLGDTETLEKKLETHEKIASVEVTDVRRAIG